MCGDVVSIAFKRHAMLAAAAAIGLGGTAWWWWTARGPTPPSTTQTASNLKFGGPFTLVDHTGKTVTDRDFIGRHQLIFFGFTSCPAVCPTALQTVTLALEELGSLSDQLWPLFVSVDPQNDTPKVLADYLTHFDRRIIGLTGTPAQITIAAKAFHIVYKRVRDSDGSEQVEHTAVFYLMGPDGTFLTHIPPDTSPRKMASIIRSRLVRSSQPAVETNT